jgi:hypothetical protein
VSLEDFSSTQTTQNKENVAVKAVDAAADAQKNTAVNKETPSADAAKL